MCIYLEFVGLRVHVEQRIVGDPVAIRVDIDVARDAGKRLVPHSLHDGSPIRLVTAPGQRLVERQPVQQDRIVECCHERGHGLVAERVVVLFLCQAFHLKTTVTILFRFRCRSHCFSTLCFAKKSNNIIIVLL